MREAVSAPRAATAAERQAPCPGAPATRNAKWGASPSAATSARRNGSPFSCTEGRTHGPSDRCTLHRNTAARRLGPRNSIPLHGPLKPPRRALRFSVPAAPGPGSDGDGAGLGCLRLEDPPSPVDACRAVEEQRGRSGGRTGHTLQRHLMQVTEQAAE